MFISANTYFIVKLIQQKSTFEKSSPIFFVNFQSWFRSKKLWFAGQKYSRYHWLLGTLISNTIVRIEICSANTNSALPSSAHRDEDVDRCCGQNNPDRDHDVVEWNGVAVLQFQAKHYLRRQLEDGACEVPEIFVKKFPYMYVSAS